MVFKISARSNTKSGSRPKIIRMSLGGDIKVKINKKPHEFIHEEY